MAHNLSSEIELTPAPSVSVGDYISGLGTVTEVEPLGNYVLFRFGDGTSYCAHECSVMSVIPAPAEYSMFTTKGEGFPALPASPPALKAESKARIEGRLTVANTSPDVQFREYAAEKAKTETSEVKV